MRLRYLLFLFAIALLCRPALADSFLVTIPAVTGASVSSDFQISVPPVSARAESSVFQVTVPVIVAKTKRAEFSMTLPALRASAVQNQFVITLEDVIAQSRSISFVLTAPTVTATALGDGNQTPVTGATGAGDLACEALRACFSNDDIQRVEADLMSYGYTPQTYERFCQDVAQSLGACTVDLGTGLSPPDPTDLAGFAGQHLGKTSDLWTMNRCLPFEDYMRQLQARSDAGEDVTVDAERLQLLIVSSQNLLLRGRSDVWCAAVAADL